MTSWYYNYLFSWSKLQQACKRLTLGLLRIKPTKWIGKQTKKSYWFINKENLLNSMRKRGKKRIIYCFLCKCLAGVKNLQKLSWRTGKKTGHWITRKKTSQTEEKQEGKTHIKLLVWIRSKLKACAQHLYLGLQTWLLGDEAPLFPFIVCLFVQVTMFLF